MGADYIPEQDFFAEICLRNFATQVAADPDGYRARPADAEETLAAAEAFRAALRATETPGVRSNSLIARKNSARRDAEGLIRAMAQRIKRDKHIPSALKVKVGLAPPARRRHSVPTPDSAPSLCAVSDWQGAMTLHVWDSITQTRKRPAEAMALELYERIRPRAAVDAESVPQRADDDDTAEEIVIDRPAQSFPWRFVGVRTAWPMEERPMVKAVGDEVSYVARWITRQGKPGPFGMQTSVRSNYNPMMHLLAGQRCSRAA